jgi:hypothetical protein
MEWSAEPEVPAEVLAAWVDAHGARAVSEWLADAERRIASCSGMWGVTMEGACPGGALSVVRAGRRADGARGAEAVGAVGGARDRL